MMKLILGCILALVIFSCQDKTPTGIINQEKMMLVLWDYMEANVYSYEQLRDTLQEDSLVNAKMQANIFKKYKVTREEFENSYGYYSKNTLLFKSMVDSIIVRKQRIDTSSNIKRGILPIDVL